MAKTIQSCVDGDTVIMNMEIRNKTAFLNGVYASLSEAEIQAREGRTIDAYDSLRAIREKYNV